MTKTTRPRVGLDRLRSRVAGHGKHFGFSTTGTSSTGGRIQNDTTSTQEEAPQSSIYPGANARHRRGQVLHGPPDSGRQGGGHKIGQSQYQSSKGGIISHPENTLIPAVKQVLKIWNILDSKVFINPRIDSCTSTPRKTPFSMSILFPREAALLSVSLY